MNTQNADSFDNAGDDAKLDRHRDALEHIAKVCEGSRQRTRRIRWIEQRALCAINNSDAWRTVQMPKHEPGMRVLSEIIASVYDIVKREIECLKDVYTGADGEIVDEQAKADLKVMERFVRDAYHEVESIREYERHQAEGRPHGR